MSGLNTNQEEEGYCAFNVMNRPAMLIGIPVKLLLILSSLLLVTGFAGPLLLGWAGVSFPLLIFVLLLTVKFICENDPNAPQLAILRLRSLFFRLGGSRNNLFFFYATNPELKSDETKKFVVRFFKILKR